MKKLTVRRLGARGDVLLATAILPALRERCDELYFSTQPACAHVLTGHPALTGVIGPRDSMGDLIVLDDAYEREPLTHIVEAYCKAAGVVLSESVQPFLRGVVEVPQLYDVIIHPTVSWASRTLPLIFWQRLAWHFADAGKRVAVIRTRNEPKLTGDTDDYCDVSIKGVGSLIASSRVFIGADSMPMHIAATTKTPIVGLFTIARPKYRYPWKRDEKLFTGILANVACAGCLHREPPPVRFAECRLDAALKNQCVESFNVDEVFKAAMAYL